MWANAILKDVSCCEKYTIEQETLHIYNFNNIVWNNIHTKLGVFCFPFLPSMTFSLPLRQNQSESLVKKKWNYFIVYIYSPLLRYLKKKSPRVMRTFSLVFRINCSYCLKCLLSMCLLYTVLCPEDYIKSVPAIKWFIIIYAFLPAQNSPMTCFWYLQNWKTYTYAKKDC